MISKLKVRRWARIFQATVALVVIALLIVVIYLTFKYS